ncbi:putative quinol monooxygenase [Sinorhizobium medicae]|uniref:ABM domain-containing protein n=1 Tax=Sinorhizobium medicae TaxID=110321 RepID=A0A508XB23_9HYPH|nr:putative quinol monooxygenase [Sinorhizobium medicae]VTZ65483.1 conserved hypothetical protein [Sinorhizobium medicae]
MKPTLSKAAFFFAKPGKSEELGERLLALVDPTRQEEGCLRYHILKSSDDPDHWFIYEDWRSEADFNGHMVQPYIREFMGVVGDLCRDEVEICTYVQASPSYNQPNLN